ncbi:MAG: hypothetical protein KF802_08850 [Bdellovibrionaceae bacterium]|nr:hypothetical protein [Pseudobdellovibrionaceae bacterium]MBX3034157.1 hypothetical protein [Pseudobdellovibrionaceae bacterium]
MKALIMKLALSMAAFLATTETVWAAESVKSYREWKNTQVSEAKGRYETVKNRLNHHKHDPGARRQKPATHRLEAQVYREKVAVETAQELTVSDYFAGYLAKMSNKNSVYKEVAGKLSPEEVAELMSAYANSVFGTQNQGGSLPASALQLGNETK